VVFRQAGQYQVGQLENRNVLGSRDQDRGLIMSKKRREAMEQHDQAGTNTENTAGNSSTWWRSLNGTQRWIAVGLIGFLSIGVLGAGLKYLEDSARQEMALRKQNPLEKNESLLNRVNPFMPMPTPTPTPQLSKEYIYAGSRLLAVEDAAASAIPPADLAVWRPSDGYWYCVGGTGSTPFTTAWGTSGDIPAQGDYDGDGKTDLAIFRPSTNTWWIYPSGGASAYTVSIGASGGTPAQADYDGDGKTDPAVFQSGAWNIFKSSTQTAVSASFGLSGDLLAPADYDGDGKADLAVWRGGTTGTFYVLKSTDGQTLTQNLGTTGDTPVPGDYDGDSKADFALRSGNDWIIKQSSDGSTYTVTWYLGTDIAVQNDYDADGKTDIASWRPSSKGAGNWYIRQSSRIGQVDEVRLDHWGAAGDVPVPDLYRR
jgi:hypothetical protein